jgi:hypothetical protein
MHPDLQPSLLKTWVEFQTKRHACCSSLEYQSQVLRVVSHLYTSLLRATITTPSLVTEITAVCVLISHTSLQHRCIVPNLVLPVLGFVLPGSLILYCLTPNTVLSYPPYTPACPGPQKPQLGDLSFLQHKYTVLGFVLPGSLILYCLTPNTVLLTCKLACSEPR